MVEVPVVVMVVAVVVEVEVVVLGVMEAAYDGRSMALAFLNFCGRAEEGCRLPWRPCCCCCSE